MRTPDFLIVGAMKCGTSTLAAQLKAQDGIFVTSPKEPNYFSDDAVFANGPGWYGSLFDDANEGDLLGEASTHYTKSPNHPHTVGRAKAALDQVKIVYLVRNPIDRVVSHYIHEWSMGRIKVDIDTALRTNPELIEYGRYAYQIQPWIEAFGKENVLILSLEEMKRTPDAVLDEVCRFVGFKGIVSWTQEFAQENVSAERSRPLPLHSLLVDNPIATTLRRALVPKSVRTWIRRRRQMVERPELSPRNLSQLERIFEKDFKELKRLFPHASFLDSSYQFSKPR